MNSPIIPGPSMGPCHQALKNRSSRREHKEGRGQPKVLVRIVDQNLTPSQLSLLTSSAIPLVYLNEQCFPPKRTIWITICMSPTLSQKDHVAERWMLQVHTYHWTSTMWWLQGIYRRQYWHPITVRGYLVSILPTLLENWGAAMPKVKKKAQENLTGCIT